MEREQANELVNRVIGLYIDRWDRPEKGKPYSYYYDIRTLTPLPELVYQYRRAEEELTRVGAPLS